jgi:hypothetical protein
VDTDERNPVSNQLIDAEALATLAGIERFEMPEETERIERMMADADDRTREVLELYGGLHPVTFGHCGYPELCVRGTARCFCLGCPFLVRRPEYIDRVDFLLKGYLTAADAHERMGDLAGARERKRLIAELRQLKSEMPLLAEAERHGTWKPPWKDLPSLSAGSVNMTEPDVQDPFAHLKRRASERADRTVERLDAGITALRATGRTITAETITREWNQGSPG